MKNKKYLVFCILAATHLCVTTTHGMVLGMLKKDNKTEAQNSKESVTTDTAFAQSLREKIVKTLFKILDLNKDKTKNILRFIKENFKTECELSGLKKGLFHIFPTQQIIRIKIDDFQIFLDRNGELTQAPKKSSEGIRVEFCKIDEADYLEFGLEDIKWT